MKNVVSEYSFLPTIYSFLLHEMYIFDLVKLYIIVLLIFSVQLINVFLFYPTERVGEEQSNFDFSSSKVNAKIPTIVFKNVINQQCGLDSKLKNSQTLIIKCL
jgi:hypothetical protein